MHKKHVILYWFLYCTHQICKRILGRQTHRDTNVVQVLARQAPERLAETGLGLVSAQSERHAAWERPKSAHSERHAAWEGARGARGAGTRAGEEETRDGDRTPDQRAQGANTPFGGPPHSDKTLKSLLRDS